MLSQVLHCLTEKHSHGTKHFKGKNEYTDSSYDINGDHCQTVKISNTVFQTQIISHFCMSAWDFNLIINIILITYHLFFIYY